MCTFFLQKEWFLLEVHSMCRSVHLHVQVLSSSFAGQNLMVIKPSIPLILFLWRATCVFLHIPFTYGVKIGQTRYRRKDLSEIYPDLEVWIYDFSFLMVFLFSKPEVPFCTLRAISCASRLHFWKMIYHWKDYSMKFWVLWVIFPDSSPSIFYSIFCIYEVYWIS